MEERKGQKLDLLGGCKRLQYQYHLVLLPKNMKYYPTHPTWQDQHRWRCGYHGMYRVLKQIHPYLIMKKQKAKVVIDHYNKKFKEKKYGKGKFGQ